MKQPIVALFDIDGTLLTAAGAGRRAIDRAIHKVCGVTGTMQNAELAGRTDPWIVRTALSRAGLSTDPSTVSRVLGGYVQFLAEEIGKVEARAHEGVVELLDTLRGDTKLALGLGTGNLEGLAEVKLSAVGLREYFGFGGFSSDHEERGKLLKVGAERGAARFGVRRSDCTVIVIGDTPHDVVAARAIGARCIAVATGGYSETALRQTKADIVVQTLQDTRVLGFIRGAD